MRPFNLDECKAGKPVQLVNGTDLRFVAEVPENGECCLLFVSPQGFLYCRNKEGTSLTTSLTGSNPAYDVVMKTVKKTVYVNLIPEKSGWRRGFWHETEAAAKKDAESRVPSYLAIAIPVEIDI